MTYIRLTATLKWPKGRKRDIMESLKGLGYNKQKCDIDKSEKYVSTNNGLDDIENTIYIHKISEVVEISQIDYNFGGREQTVQLEFELVEAIYNQMKESKGV